MDPASIALAIGAARTAVGAAKGIQSIGHALDGMFKAQEEHKKNKQKSKPTTRMQQVLKIRAGDEGYDDETSISAVANAVLAEKQTARALENLATEIDNKWGKGTWEQILQQRKKLLAERSASDQLAKENALKKKKDDTAFWHKFWIETGKAALIICFAGLVILFLWWASSANISQLR